MPAIHHWACRQAVGVGLRISKCKFVDTENLAQDFHQSCSYALSYVSAPPPPQPLDPYRPYEHGSSLTTAPPSSKSFSNVDHKLDSSAGSKSSVPATRRFKPRFSAETPALLPFVYFDHEHAAQRDGVIIPPLQQLITLATSTRIPAAHRSCLLTMKGSNNDKKLPAMRIVAHVFEIIHLLADQSSIQVLVDAVVKNECLADGLFDTAKGLCSLFAIEKKDELECVAKSNR
ncbi:hypothetical protein B0H13DRAFT_2318671 [Mycena leptocephala]|nr:hypothetical protein B0H13DRAFT_2318671 [Mycena leptocephala]